jgi:hypothetical protein
VQATGAFASAGNISMWELAPVLASFAETQGQFKTPISPSSFRWRVLARFGARAKNGTARFDTRP